MNDAAIKNFAVAARQGLMRDVATQMRRWAIDEEATVPAAADVLNGRPLTAAERAHRAALLERCARMGRRALCEQAAYTWFNRLAAIRCCRCCHGINRKHGNPQANGENARLLPKEDRSRY